MGNIATLTRVYFRAIGDRYIFYIDKYGYRRYNLAETGDEEYPRMMKFPAVREIFLYIRK
jgi:hypothetical protein